MGAVVANTTGCDNVSGASESRPADAIRSLTTPSRALSRTSPESKAVSCSRPNERDCSISFKDCSVCPARLSRSDVMSERNVPRNNPPSVVSSVTDDLGPRMSRAQHSASSPVAPFEVHSVMRAGSRSFRKASIVWPFQL